MERAEASPTSLSLKNHLGVHLSMGTESRHIRILLSISVTAASLWFRMAKASADQPNAELCSRAAGILRSYCYRCHSGPEAEKGGFDASDPTSLAVRKDHTRLIAPGKPDESEIWLTVNQDRHPKEGPRFSSPTREERETLKAWIEQGAVPPPLEERRPHLGIHTSLVQMRDHLRKLPPDRRRHTRYFTLTHLYNQRAVTKFDLRLYRAALSKSLNSLSWEPKIVIPQPVDAAETIFAVDISELGWQPKMWQQIASHYPYGLSYAESPDERFKSLYLDLKEMSTTSLPAIRTDWFVATAMRPPLYDQLLHLPQTQQELEATLKVNQEAAFFQDTTQWAGLLESRDTGEPRHFRRYESQFGGCWITTNFSQNNPNRNLLRHPLGPQFPNHPFPNLAFQQDWGEIMFTLPNGLQGYMIIDEKGRKMQSRPIKPQPAGPKKANIPQPVLAGLSCIGCHRHGVVAPLKDEIALNSIADGAARVKLKQLSQDTGRNLMSDKERFLGTLQVAVLRFVGPEYGGNGIVHLGEPISEAEHLYRLRDLTAEIVAAELGLAKVEELSLRHSEISSPARDVLNQLTAKRRISRADWEDIRGLSLMQRIARDLPERGTPLRLIHVE